MNSEIKELRLQACKWASENGPVEQLENISDEKFAEFIIKECAAIAWFAEQYNIGDRVPISKQIETRFGITNERVRLNIQRSVPQ